MTTHLTALRLTPWLLALWLVTVSTSVSAETDVENLRLEVVEPYLELSTGPAKGYPLFYAVERGEWIKINKTSNGWYEVETRRGKTGWVSRQALEKTRTMTGSTMRFSRAGEADFRRRQLEIGITTGAFENDPTAGLRIGYFLSDGISAELAVTHVPGEFSRSLILSANVLMQPWPQWRYSPYFSLGGGQLDNEPKATLVGGVDSTSTVWNAAVGVRGYISRTFMFRLEYRQHVAVGDDSDNDEFQELMAGLSFFY